jgi:hypothetical protein
LPLFYEANGDLGMHSTPPIIPVETWAPPDFGLDGQVNNPISKEPRYSMTLHEPGVKKAIRSIPILKEVYSDIRQEILLSVEISAVSLEQRFRGHLEGFRQSKKSQK